MKGKRKYIITFFFLMLPNVLLQIALINLFPYTGLGRIISIPSTIVVDSLIIIYCIVLIKRNNWKKRLPIMVVLIVTISITVGLYPQEFNPPILVQSKNAVNAIQDFDQIQKKDLIINNDGLNDPRYVVALYKFKDDLLDEGVYQLYQRENVYFYNYSINDLEEIPSKLIGYHKVMWWYLNLLNY